MKRLSTVRDTQRGSRSYMEKIRGRKEIEVTRRREGVERGESNQASNQFQVLYTVWITREVHGVTQRREEGGGRKRWPGREEEEFKGERPV